MTNVCVVGLGRIGLPLALVLAKANHQVYGVDTNPTVVSKIRSIHGCSDSIKENELLEEYLEKRFFVTDSLEEGLKKAEIVFIAIGTSISSNGNPDLFTLFVLIDYICNIANSVKGKLFVLKSTLPVGTTRQIAHLLESRSGLLCGRDFYFAFCPERVLGDKAISEMESLPKIIGGMDPESTKRAVNIYETIGGKVVVMESPEAAELVKLLDNSYRQTIFAFSNDFALLAERYGLNALKIINAANESYPRNNIPMPSAGVSGYCLTKDPLYLEMSFKEIAAKRGFSSIWYYGRKTNDYMPIHVINRVAEHLEQAGKTLKESTILICGLTYKENTNDVRNSHGIEIAHLLQEKGSQVIAWDPHILDTITGIQLVSKPDEILETLDAIIFVVKHDEFIKLNKDCTILQMVRKMRLPIIFDGWGIFDTLNKVENIHYFGIGIPSKTLRDS
ncbi:MAG: nucleotide sugar dehydrogenase [Nitrososphaerota archaeon]|jgi:nucleotide sugar dehydrogenase|nr:nucleotide sugar dehydrogenase [Nitrososphaerota archaeon]